MTEPGTTAQVRVGQVSERVLTSREREVLRLVASGLTYREIAAHLVIAPSTARTHTRHLLLKLGARTLAHAVTIAVRRGELHLELVKL